MIIKHLSRFFNINIEDNNKKIENNIEVSLEESNSSAYKLSISDYGLKYMKQNQNVNIALFNTNIESYNENLTLNKKG